jgi:hypothetical protein
LREDVKKAHMTSLSETYGGAGGAEVGPRRLSLGVGLFLGGTLLLVAGILAAAEVFVPADTTSGAARRLGGILGGIGVPLVTLGVMTVLPADRRTRVAAVVGAVIMALGVALFSQAYPTHWVGGPRPELVDLTLPTAGVYFLGAATIMWSVFVGVANFKTRNDPGGTVTMEVTHKGETRVIEVDRNSIRGLGGVGLVGEAPDGSVETQTNSASLGPSGAAGVSDGGDATPAISSPLDGTDRNSPSPGPRQTPSSSSSAASGSRSDPTSSARTTTPSSPSRPMTADGPGDVYCGNCAKFDYVSTEDGMAPYCGLHDELMEDMMACDEWTPQ